MSDTDRPDRPDRFVLALTSIQAPNQDGFAAGLATLLTAQLGRAVVFRSQPPWTGRERELDDGAIQLGWICGLPYVERMAARPEAYTLLAAPVPLGARYGDRPVYFSDILVRSDSPAQRFADLRHAVWAYNEPHSHSGFNITRYQLARAGYGAGFFRRVVAAGSHQRALTLLLRGRIDATALDSTVLAIELAARPELARALRVIGSWGPSPSPPWVARRELPADLLRSIRAALLNLHRQEQGQELLRRYGFRRLAPVNDVDYDPIRIMARRAAGVSW